MPTARSWSGFDGLGLDRLTGAQFARIETDLASIEIEGTRTDEDVARLRHLDEPGDGLVGPVLLRRRLSDSFVRVGVGSGPAGLAPVERVDGRDLLGGQLEVEHGEVFRHPLGAR
jgi:hypothetical protein